MADTTAKIGDWFNTTATPTAPNPGSGLINSNYDKDSGVFGVQTATTGMPKTTDPTMLNLGDLDRRTVDAPKETVSGQIKNIIDENSPLQQQAEARSMQEMNKRGLLNSSMAVTAGQSALYDAALPIAQADASVYGKAADYNTALTNQGRMYNADTANKSATQQTVIQADKDTAAAQQASQMSIAQLQSETSKYQADKQAATAANNNDNTYRDTQAKNRTTLVNNIIQSPELSPDRKAALLTQMGEAGLASAIYVVGSVAPDLVAPDLVAPSSPAWTPPWGPGAYEGS